MLSGPVVFVDVDTQRDFLEAGAPLYVADSEQILPNLARLTAFARSRGIPVIASACSHSPDDPELRTFRPHCMTGTPGQERVPETSWAESLVIEADEPLAGDPPAHVTLNKREFSLFSHRAADRLVSWYNRERPLFVVYGVATDYCVRSAVEGLLDRDARTALVVDAIRAIDPSAEAELLASFVARGTLLTMTDIVCSA